MDRWRRASAIHPVEAFLLCVLCQTPFTPTSAKSAKVLIPRLCSHVRERLGCLQGSQRSPVRVRTGHETPRSRAGGSRRRTHCLAVKQTEGKLGRHLLLGNDWTFHYRPKHPPVSPEVEAALSFIGGFNRFDECLLFDFEEVEPVDLDGLPRRLGISVSRTIRLRKSPTFS